MQCYSTNMTCLDTAGPEDGKIIEREFQCRWCGPCLHVKAMIDDLSEEQIEFDHLGMEGQQLVSNTVMAGQPPG